MTHTERAISHLNHVSELVGHARVQLGDLTFTLLRLELVVALDSVDVEADLGRLEHELGLGCALLLDDVDLVLLNLGDLLLEPLEFVHFKQFLMLF